MVSFLSHTLHGWFAWVVGWKQSWTSQVKMFHSVCVYACDALAIQPAVWGRGMVHEAQNTRKQLGANWLNINSVLALRLPRCHRQNMLCVRGIWSRKAVLTLLGEHMLTPEPKVTLVKIQTGGGGLAWPRRMSLRARARATWVLQRPRRSRAQHLHRPKLTCGRSAALSHHQRAQGHQGRGRCGLRQRTVLATGAVAWPTSLQKERSCTTHMVDAAKVLAPSGDLNM